MTMSKTDLAIVITALAALCLLLGIVSMSPQNSKASGFSLSAHDTNNDSGATTTQSFLTSGNASTTFATFTPQADQIRQNWVFVASSTSSCLQWQNSYSNNNVDWYGEDNASTTNKLANEAPGPLIHVWCPAISGTSTLMTLISTAGEKYSRTQFVATGANGSVYLQEILKNTLTN